MKALRYKGVFGDGSSKMGRGTGKGTGSDQELRIVIYFDGRIDENIMEKTLHAITYIDPVIGCRFFRKEFFKGYWERREDIDELQLCSLVKTGDGDAAVMRYLTEYQDPEKFPLLRACIVRTTQSDIFCLRVDHGLADGGGTKEAAYLIADTYKKIAANPSITYKLERFKKRSFLSLIKYKGPFKLPLDTPHAPMWMGNFLKPVFKLPFKGTRNEDPDYAIRRLEPEAFLKLKQYGKLHHSTVNDLILTALVRTMCRISDVPEGTPYSLQVSSDIRSRLPKDVGYTVSNLFGIHFPEFICHPEESFEETLAMVSRKMDSIRKNDITLEKRIQQELFTLAMRRRMIHERIRKNEEFFKNRPHPNWERPSDTTHIISSNFTIIDDTKLDFGDIQIKDAFELGTISFGKEFMLTASTYKNQLTLANGYCHSDINHSAIDEVMDAIVNELHHGINRI